MDFMEDPTFKTKYHKHKIRVKLWESDFMEKYGRKPNKNDIKVADISIREAYKIYWKLKTIALEETLTEINFCQDSLDESNVKTISKLINYPEKNQYKNENILDNSDNSENACSITYLPKITNSIILSENLNVEGAWDHHLNENINEKCIKTNQGILISRSSFQLSQNLFKSSNLSKRNPRKSKLEKSKLELSNNLKKYDLEMNDYEISNILHSSSNDYLKIINDKKKVSDEPTIQQLIEKFKTCNRKLNKNWLNKCIDNEFYENCKSETLKISEHNDFKFDSCNVLTQSLLHNSCTDDEDYICNSDSDEERKRKRIRNLDKNFFNNSKPCKKLCIISNKSNNTYINKQVLKSSLTKNHSINKNNLQNENNIIVNKMMNSKKFEENIANTKNNSSSTYYNNKLPSLRNKQNFMSNNFHTNENISNGAIKNLIYQIPKQNLKLSNVIECSLESNDIIDFPCILEPVNKEMNILLSNESHENKRYIEHSLDTKKLNENFVKVNLKKKVFVRSKKIFNLSKYKKNQWKLRKKGINIQENNCKLANFVNINDRFKCFNCGEIGHFSKYCKNLNDESLLPNTNEDISRYPTDKAEYKNYQSINILENKISIITQAESENLTEKSSLQEISSFYELNADNTVIDTPLEVMLALKKFGHNDFREGQEKAIMRILSGQSTLVTLATGSGKSLCYQLPAYMYAKKTSCITLVLSPLVSLMDDQISRIPNFLKAACLHANQKKKTQEKILANLKEGNLNILIMSPELIVRSEVISSVYGKFLNILPPIAFVCIDEVHCISQWSHNFRPAYFTICKMLKEKFGVKRFLGLTATASNTAITNIIKFLNIKDKELGVISDKCVPFNLNLTISRDLQREEALVNLIRSEKFIKFNSIIVYCTRREECVRIAKILRISLHDLIPKQFDPKAKISPIAEAYHAGLSAHWRKIVQNAFMKSEIRIIVATVAFGMGINKSNIRSVIHFNMPSNFESYVQEIGRAGRDGLSAHCHLFLNSEPNVNECELRRHINANKIDRHTIRRMLQKIFIPCYCNKQSKLRCPGHEIAFSIEETVKMLDLPEAAIVTLLCYLELHPKHFIKFLPSTYIRAKISSLKGPDTLKIAAESTPFLSTALSLLKKRGKYNDTSSVLEFSIIDIASMMGLHSSTVKNQLKKLEWNTVDGKMKKSSLSVKFDTLSFHVIASGDLSNEELEEALDYLSHQNKLHTTMCLQQLKFISMTLQKFSSASVKECYDLNKEIHLKSEELKKTICNYFENNECLSSISIHTETKLENEGRVVVDIHDLISSYKDVHFTGRTIARIFHGIESPNHSVLIWSKSPFWRAHINEDFDAICYLATKEILKIKKI